MVAFAQQDDSDDPYRRYLDGPVVDQADQILATDVGDEAIGRVWGLPDHEGTPRDVVQRTSKTKDSGTA